MLMQEISLKLLKLFFRWQNDAPRRCWRLILLIVIILSGFHPPSMKFQMLRLMKLPRAVGTTLGTMIANTVESRRTNNTITRVKRTLTRNHGKTRTKSCGTKTTSLNMVTRSPSPKMLALQLLKM